jgi:hypothetical protein
MPATFEEKLVWAIALFLNVPAGAVNVRDIYKPFEDEDVISAYGSVDLNWLQVLWNANFNSEGTGSIQFQLVPFETIKIENANDFNGDEGIWEFEMENWEISPIYARYGV